MQILKKSFLEHHVVSAISSERVFIHTLDKRRLVMNSFKRPLKTTLHPSSITELQTHCWVIHAGAVCCAGCNHFALFRTKSIVLQQTKMQRAYFIFNKIPARLHKDFSPSASVNVMLRRSWIVVNEVTPPNFCLAHLTSSSSWVGKSCLRTFLWCPLACRVILESLFIWKVEPRSCQLLS